MSLEESLLVVLTIGVCAVPFFVRRRLLRGWVWGIGLFSAIFLVAGGIVWNKVISGNIAKEQFRHEILPRPRTEGGYVASDKCQSCHPSQYASWHHSYHRTMTQVATPQSVVGDFEGITLRSKLGDYFLETRGDEYWAGKIDPRRATKLQNGDGSPHAGLVAPEDWKQLVMTTGSHQNQAYWVRGQQPNDLRLFPFAYLIQKGKWAPFNSIFISDPERTFQPPAWNFGCIDCHSTGGQPRPRNASHMDTRVRELGIACEACHGPAEEHVRVNRNPLRRYTFHSTSRSDSTIVDPRDETHRSSSQICGQCHSVNFPADPQRYLNHGSDYRPGRDLARTHGLMRPTNARDMHRIAKFLEQHPDAIRNRFWSDGMVRVSGREYNGMIESPCYQRGTMSCLSCHSMHHYQDRADQLALEMDSDKACVQCHASYGDRIQEHTHHAPDSAGSRCYNCHMPHTAYGLQKAIRSHHIDSPTVKSSIETGRPNACNLCHVDKSLGWAQEHLEQWYETPPVQLTKEQTGTSAILLWLLRGDAGQRALAAEAIRHSTARQSSEEAWVVPFLAQLLNDPYPVVRLISERALKQIAGFETIVYDFLAPEEERIRCRDEIIETWKHTSASRPKRTSAVILFRPDGTLDQEVIQRLLSERDDRKVDLEE